MNEFSELTWLIALPLIASPLIYLIGRIASRRKGDSDPANPARWLALAALLADLVPLWAAWQKINDSLPVVWQDGLIRLELDGLGFLLALIVLGLGALVVLFSSTYMQGEVGEEKFYALLVAMIGTIIGLGAATDLFNLWVWFEAMAVTSYMLVAFYREQAGSLEAGFKYLVQSATGSILVLLGISLVFTATGTLDLRMISTAGTQGAILWVAGALFLVGFGVKAALVPLHTWLPDAHSQAPSGISAMLSGVVIEAGLVALLRVIVPLTPAGGRSWTWGVLLLGFAAANMLLGNLMALRQTQVKRMLAFSSISHMGYILLGVGAALVFDRVAGAAGAFFHLLTHAAMKGLAFLAVGALLYALKISRGNHEPLVVEDLNGAARNYPIAAFTLSVAVLGLGGLPPLAGFWSKWQIFVAGFETGSGWMIGLVLFAALNSVLSLGYYAPLVNRMYRFKPGAMVESGGQMSWLLIAPLIILATVVIGLGLWPGLVEKLTLSTVHSLMPFLGG